MTIESAALNMLAKYNCKTSDDYQHALKEIVQQIALLGLWRAKFYEHALFYGGTALRILYNLPRFSEDLDFALLKYSGDFNLKNYNLAVKEELEAFGFHVEISEKVKNWQTNIQTTLIRAPLKTNFINVELPADLIERTQHNQSLKIKLEIDTDPPLQYGIEVKEVYAPIPFQVKTMPLTDLFACKIAAILGRNWGTRVKGRDFYDYLWFFGGGVPINIHHLDARLKKYELLSPDTKLTLPLTKELLEKRFSEIHFDQAREDISAFIDVRQQESLTLWNQEYFLKTVQGLAES